jgi:phage shock protein A
VTTSKVHPRKISVSTSEISHLADQNAELLEKLEQLESDSFSADQSGRRELKRLEKEISALREELEKTQAKSEELEEKAKAGFAWDSEKVVQEVLRKKSVREERFRAMRNLGQGLPSENEGDSEIRDFAPESSFYPPGDTPRRASGTPFRHPLAQNPHPTLSTQPEPSLISQLLCKIQELEQTNIRIIEQQTETATQLSAMQRETEHMTRVYECFADENPIELAPDLEPATATAELPSREDTIRFRSFKRNLGVQPIGVLPDNLDRSVTHPRIISKTRKSVMGLFDVNAEAKLQADFKADQRLFSLPIPFASSPCSEGQLTTRSISTGLFSPALSTLSLSSSRSQEPDS